MRRMRWAILLLVLTPLCCCMIIGGALTIGVARNRSERHATPGERGAVLLFYPVVDEKTPGAAIAYGVRNPPKKNPDPLNLTNPGTHYDQKQEIAVRVVEVTLGPATGWGWGRANARWITFRFSAEDRDRLRQFAAAHPADWYIYRPQFKASFEAVVRISDMDDSGCFEKLFFPGDEERVFELLCGR
jgi:hypothetical protein